MTATPNAPPSTAIRIYWIKIQGIYIGIFEEPAISMCNRYTLSFSSDNESLATEPRFNFARIAYAETPLNTDAGVYSLTLVLDDTDFGHVFQALEHHLGTGELNIEISMLIKDLIWKWNSHVIRPASDEDIIKQLAELGADVEWL